MSLVETILAEEAERLIRETMEKKNLVVKQGDTRIEAVCGKWRRAEPGQRPQGPDPRQVRLQELRAQARDAVGRSAQPFSPSPPPKRRAPFTYFANASA